MVREHDVVTPDGRTLHVHDSADEHAVGHADPATPVLLWHHGSPQTGALLAPVLAATAARGIRLLSYGRPSYGGSDPMPGRTVADAAADVRVVVDQLGIASFMTMGASGGGPHALASAALLPGRVSGVVCLAGIAPFEDTDAWWSGMAAPGGLRAAREGREARARFAETDEFDPTSFVDTDYAALNGAWGAIGQDSGRADAAGPDGLIDDDVAFTAPWGFTLDAVTVPVLLVQGERDRVVPPAHARLQAAALPVTESWIRPRDGHIAVLGAVPLALDWLLEHAR